MFKEKKLVAEINELKIRSKLKDGAYDSLKEQLHEEKSKRAYWRDLYFNEHTEDNKLNGLIKKLNAAKESVTINTNDPFYEIANQHASLFKEMGWDSERYYLYGNVMSEKPDAIVFTKKPTVDEIKKIMDKIIEVKNRGSVSWWIEVDKSPQAELILNNIPEIMSLTGVDILREGQIIPNEYQERGVVGIHHKVPENILLIILSPSSFL